MTKIICVGFQKTGTSSIAVALSRLGYTVGNPHRRVMDEMNWKSDDPYAQLKQIMLEVLAENDAVEDTPSAFFHREMDEAFPGSKFILTRRKTENWLRSFTRFFSDKFNGPRIWMYGVDRLTGNEKAICKVYEDKNQEIIDYFKDRPDDFLILDLENGDGWLKLVTFLGEDFLKPFPHENKGMSGWRSKANQRRIFVITRIFYVITIIVLLAIWANQ